jgi:hypothetical protein
MKRHSMHMICITAAALLSLPALQASHAQGLEDDSWSETATVVFEENIPSTAAVDGLLLDLPVDYFAEFSLPPMGDFTIDEGPILLAGLDLLSTP